MAGVAVACREKIIYGIPANVIPGYGLNI